MSGPGLWLQGTGVEAVGSNAAHTSTQRAGVVTPPAAPPAKQEEEVGAESVPASTFATAHEVDKLMASPIVLKTYRFVRSTNLEGRRDSAGQLKAATQVSSPRPIFRTPAEMQEEHTVRHRESPCRLCTMCWAELRQEAASLMGQLNVHPEGGCTAADAANALRMHRGGCTAATRSELAMARKCIYANRADFGQLRELIAELRKLVLTDEVLGET